MSNAQVNAEYAKDFYGAMIAERDLEITLLREQLAECQAVFESATLATNFYSSTVENYITNSATRIAAFTKDET